MCTDSKNFTLTSLPRDYSSVIFAKNCLFTGSISSKMSTKYVTRLKRNILFMKLSSATFAFSRVCHWCLLCRRRYSNYCTIVMFAHKLIEVCFKSFVTYIIKLHSCFNICSRGINFKVLWEGFKWDNLSINRKLRKLENFRIPRETIH